MTSSFNSKIRQAGLVLAIALTTSLISSQSFAFSSEAKSMCMSDAFRLCSSEIPNIPKITSCMIQHKSELSSGCRSVMDKELSGKSGKVAATEQ
jgi:hypothetical protein